MAVLTLHVPASATERLTLVSIDASHYPTVAVNVAAPAALSRLPVPPEAFKLWEHGATRPLEVARAGGEGLEVVLVFDTSSRVSGDSLRAAQNAATSLLMRLPRGSRVAVVGASETPTVPAPLTSDVGAAIMGITTLQIRGAPAIRPGLLSALQQFSPDGRTRRAVVMVCGDDDDATSRADGLDQGVSAALADRGAVFYAIPLGEGRGTTESLSRLASGVEGRVLPASDDPQAVFRLYDQVAEELLNQYRLTFRASRRGPTEVRVRLDIRGTIAEVKKTVELAPPSVAGSPLAAGRAVNPGAGPPGTVSGSRLLSVLLVLNAGCFTLALAFQARRLWNRRRP